MISEEDSETNSANSGIAGEISTNLEENHSELAEPSTETQSKTAPSQTEHCETIIGTSEDVNATILISKEPVIYTASATANSNTILSFSQSEALNATEESMVPAIPENSVNFETQAVLSTSESSLLHKFINPSPKQEELSVSNISNTVIEDRGVRLDDHSVEAQSEDLVLQNLGGLPPWAARLKGCEKIGDSYRGYVHTEAELDILLSMHKEHTHSSWGTRQSPSSQKPSVRFMWKSQYVPYDGIPFLNSGRRATVMECQYGPRRKGNKVKVEYNEDGQPVKRAHRPTCPARIYIKRVRKFPEYKVDKSYEGTPGLRLAQERALTALRVACLESRGEERFYVQFPLEIAHEYHHEDDEMMSHQTISLLPTQVNISSSRLDPRVVEKINELVARGVTDLYHVKHGVISFVEKDLFLASDEETPARHNKMFFPTITDLQNHIHLAQLALESGTLESLPPPENLPKSPSKDDHHSRKRKHAEPRRVRASKAPLRTICIRTDDPLELGKDSSLQDSQGQVYVMVPPGSGLFANSESLIGASLPLDGDKATSLVQVLTVPASASSAFLQGRQEEGTLDLTGQFLALPVVSCDNQEQITSLQSSTIVLQDSLGKEPITVIPATLGNTLNVNQQLPSHITPRSPSNITMSTAISPSTTTTPIPAVTIATPTLPSSQTTTSISPSIITVAATMSPAINTKGKPSISVGASETTVSSLEIGALVSTGSSIVTQNQNRTVEHMVVSTSTTMVPDLAMTSSNSVGPMTSSEMQMTSSSATQMTLDIPITSQYFSMSFVPVASSTALMTSPDAVTPSKILDSAATIIESIANPTGKTVTQTVTTGMPDLTDRPLLPTNQQLNLNSSVENVENSSSLNEIFDEIRTASRDINPVTNRSCSIQRYDTSYQSIETNTESVLPSLDRSDSL